MKSDAPFTGPVAQALEALPDGVVLVDADGAVVFGNQAFGHMLGVRIDELMGRAFRSLGELTETDVSHLVERVQEARKAELLLTVENGRQVLASLRRFGADVGLRGGMMVLLRDLAVLDHERQRVGAQGGGKATFRFLSPDRARADLAHQRRLSASLDELLTLAERAIQQSARVLLYGESGVGKTEIARYLHDFVASEAAPFVHVNCGSIPESLFESELFGYEKGAFTGALQSGKRGLIEAADGGTLFLDEIGEVPLIMQAKMLKFLETATVQRVGSSVERQVKLRILSATNRDLEAMVSAGTFRRDLYYRIAVVPLHVKPLRESRELITELANHFVALVNQRREEPLVLQPDALAALQRYGFPGNIRELQNIVQQISVRARGVAGLDQLPAGVARAELPAPPAMPGAVPCAPLGDLRSLVGAYEMQVIREAIARLGSKRKAAEALGVDIGTIVRKTQSTLSKALADPVSGAGD